MSLWRYLDGAKPPPSKKTKQTSEERKEAGRDYDKNKRQRKFCEKWMRGEDGSTRDWLIYDKELNTMHCLACKEFCTKDALRKGPFVQGTDVFRLEYIRDHEKSQSHKQCALIAAAKKAPKNSSVAEKTIATLNKAQTARMKLLFRTAHALAKNGRPFTDFEWMCK